MSRTAGGRVDGGPATPVVQAPPPEPGARWTPRPFVNGRARTGTSCPPVGGSRPTSSRRTRPLRGDPAGCCRSPRDRPSARRGIAARGSVVFLVGDVITPAGVVVLPHGEVR